MPQIRARGSHKKSERFSETPPASIPRSTYNRSYSHKTTLDSGTLVPIFVDEMLPGDTLHLEPAFFCRMATPLFPFMDGIHLDWQFFSIPYRLVWDNFIRMMGERPEPSDHNDYTVPQIEPVTIGHHDLYAYMGIPIGVNLSGMTISALPFRAYNLCYNEWYRDENLGSRIPDNKASDGPDPFANYLLRRRGKRKDYFSGALPFAQKGDAVNLPLGQSAPVVGIGDLVPLFQFNLDNAGKSLETQSNHDMHLSGSGVADFSKMEWHTTQLQADLSMASSATINDMRVAITVQHLLERDARGGTRYREMVLAHFGVQTDDIRLMRPELLNTGTMTLDATQVAATAGEDAVPDQNVGDVHAFATGAAVGRGFMHSFSEHCIVLGILSIRADLGYQDGLQRMWSRKTRLDFYWPDLAHLGEQAVLSQEIFADGSGDPDLNTGDYSVWGYQPRYEEYRHRENIITGGFKSKANLSLDVWHLAQDFATRPVLNESYIQENPPIERVLALQGSFDPEFLLDCYFKIKHVRPIPRFGKPGLSRF